MKINQSLTISSLKTHWKSKLLNAVRLFLFLMVFIVVQMFVVSTQVYAASNDVLLEQGVIAGTVTSESGEPIPGVTVVVKGTTNGTITDFDGIYTISNVPSDAVLLFSFVGMKSQEVSAAGKSQISVVMEEDRIGLEEVLVTGYSTERKKDIIGSVAVVDTEEMQSTNTATVGGQLQGRAAGVVVSSSGDPDAASKIRIRGFGSFGNSTPLYVIDGVSASEDAFNALNPNDVESIQVLKDAASASVYGARAANGVIIISTKKGKAGAAKVSVSSYTGVNFVSSNDFPELLNAEEYGEYWWKAYEGAGLTPTHAIYGSASSPVIPEYIKAGPYSGSQLQAMSVSDPAAYAAAIDPSNYDPENYQIVKSADTDWFGELFNPAQITSFQVGLSGGSESGLYSISLNYFDQDDTSNEWAGYKRYTTRANSSFNITDNITVGENLQISYTDRKGNGSGAGTAWTMNPIVPVWDIMGNPAGGSVPGIGNQRNPVTTRWRDRFDKSASFGAFGNVYMDINFLKDFTFHTSFGMNYNSRNVWNLTQQTFEHSENTTTSSLNRNTRWATSWTLTNTLTYSKTIADHTFKVMAGTEGIRDYWDDISATREDYDINDDENFVILDTGLGTQSNGGELSRESLASIFARIDYAYAGKYLFNATIRRDGSSKFGKNNRYGIFPAAAVGWRISSEDFMQDLSWLDDLKLRASYGVIGNQNGLGAENQYSQYSKLIDNGYAVNGANGVLPGYTAITIGNPDAKWEKTITSNVGFDATIFDGAFDVNFEYYIKETEDLLVQNQAAHTGSDATQPSVNVGNMRNKGVDLTITNRGQIARDLTYDASLNFSAYKNEVTQVLDSPSSYLTGASDAGMGILTRTIAGLPISYIWGYQVDGYFESEAEATAYADEYTTYITPEIGRWRIKDLSGPDGTPDKVIDEYDRTMLGSPHPDFQVGLNLSLQYKNFDFSTFVFWNQGGQVYNVSRRNTDMVRWNLNRSKRMLYESWGETDNPVLPKLDINDSETPSAAIDYCVEDVTYIRMKTLQVGYTIPSSAKFMQNLNIDRLRIYVQGQNLFTWVGGKKPFTGLDPDASLSPNADDIGMGAVESQNPTPKQFVIGLNLDF